MSSTSPPPRFHRVLNISGSSERVAKSASKRNDCDKADGSSDKQLHGITNRNLEFFSNLENQVTMSSRVNVNKSGSSTGKTNKVSDETDCTIQMTIPPHVKNSVPHNWILRVATKALCHYLLYERSMIPIPVHEIWRAIDENVEQTSADLRDSCRNGIKQPHVKKLRTFGASLQSLWDDFDLLLSPGHDSAFQSSQVLISLGPSWSRPKEHYLISYDSGDLYQNDEQKNAEEDSSDSNELGPWQHVLSSRLIRELLDRSVHSASSSGTAESSYQLHVSIKVPYQAARSFLEKTHQQQNENDNNVSQLLANRLVVRHGFSLAGQSKKKASLCTIRMDPQDKTQAPRALKKSGDDNGEEEHAVWMSFLTKVKGFKV